MLAARERRFSITLVGNDDRFNVLGRFYCRHFAACFNLQLHARFCLKYFRAPWGTAAREECHQEVVYRSLLYEGQCPAVDTSLSLIGVIRYPRRWDTRVVDVMGRDFHFADELRTEHTSIRDLLAHRTGLPGYKMALMSGLDPSRSRMDYCT